MTREQLDLVRDYLLRPGNGSELIEFLHQRGWRMTLAELEDERRARGLTWGRR